jgi:hypothetical protein
LTEVALAAEVPTHDMPSKWATLRIELAQLGVHFDAPLAPE